MHCEWTGCNFQADSEEGIYRHAIVQHTDQGSKPRCLWGGCDYNTTNRYRLKTHLKSHFSVKNYECRACGLQYKHRYNLTRHIRAIHSNISIGLLLDDKLDLDTDMVDPYARYDLDPMKSPMIPMNVPIGSTRWQAALRILFHDLDSVNIC